MIICVSHRSAVIKTTMRIYSVWDIVRVFYRLVKFLGYISFSIDGKIENGKIKSTAFDILLMTGCNIFMLYIIYINSVHDLTLIKTKSFIIDKGTRLVTLFMLTNVFISSFINSVRRFEIWSVFKTFYDFDKEVKDQLLVTFFSSIFFLF